MQHLQAYPGGEWKKLYRLICNLNKPKEERALRTLIPEAAHLCRSRITNWYETNWYIWSSNSRSLGLLSSSPLRLRGPFLFTHISSSTGIRFLMVFFFFLSRMERRERKTTLIILASRLTQQTPYLDYVELSEYPWKFSALTFKNNKYCYMTLLRLKLAKNKCPLPPPKKKKLSHSPYTNNLKIGTLTERLQKQGSCTQTPMNKIKSTFGWQVNVKFS